MRLNSRNSIRIPCIRYIIHREDGRVVNRLWYIPGCSGDALSYILHLIEAGYTSIHNGVAYHLFPKEVH